MKMPASPYRRVPFFPQSCSCLSLWAINTQPLLIKSPSQLPYPTNKTDVDLPQIPTSAPPKTVHLSLAVDTHHASSNQLQHIQRRLIVRQALLTLIVSILTASRAFDSLFKVLFIFPSRYLFAIGLVAIFSLR